MLALPLCSCTTEADGTQIVNEMGTAENPGPCYDPSAGVDTCLGSEVRAVRAAA